VRVGWGARALLASGLCLGALVAAESAASAAVATRPLRAEAFTTRVPAGWPVVAFEDDARVYRIRTPGTRFDDTGVQRPGGVGIFLSVYTRAQFVRFYGTTPPRRPADLLDTFTPPDDANEDVTLFAPHRTALGGEPALTTTFAFRFADAPDVETDLVARHGDRWVVVTVATSPDRGATAGNALRAITGSWRWRTPVTGPRARPQGGARYLGATSQGEAIAVDRTSRSSARYAFSFFPACRTITIPGQQDVSTVPVSPSARFEDRFDVAFRPFPDPAPVIAGRPRPLLLVEKAALTGRFASRDLATGTLRDRLGVFDRGSFPAPGAQLEACDTGPLTWRAGRY
jgi:hypothetical protein